VTPAMIAAPFQNPQRIPMHRETRDRLKLAMAVRLCTAGLSLGNPATLV
jgi:hypothetical protein